MNPNERVKITPIEGAPKPYDAQAFKPQDGHKHVVLWRGKRFEPSSKGHSEVIERFLKVIDPFI